MRGKEAQVPSDQLSSGCGKCPRRASAQLTGPPDLRGWWGSGEKEGEEEGGVEDLWEGAGMAPTLLGRSDRGTEEGAAGPFPPPRPPPGLTLGPKARRSKGQGAGLLLLPGHLCQPLVSHKTESGVLMGPGSKVRVRTPRLLSPAQGPPSPFPPPPGGSLLTWMGKEA